MELLTNVIYCGDCLNKLKDIPDESVDLIYIDPPFSSNRNYVAFWEEQEVRHFEDRFENVKAYIDYMMPRLKEIYRVLKQTGSFYYHCDWHAAHYVKVLLDREDLFGYDGFRDNIVWCYMTREFSRRYWNRKHDDILFYTKSNKYTFNWDVKGVLEDNSPVTIQKYKNRDEKGLYRLCGRGIKGSPIMSAKDVDQKWEIEHPELTVRSYLSTGHPPSDYWNIPIINQAAKERLGYPTQKPLALLEKIVRASSNEGDVVLDAFCGCGTALASAQANKRKWIGIDISPTACRVVAQRLSNEYNLKAGHDFNLLNMPMTVEELRVYPAFEFQNWAIIALGGTPNKSKVRDMGIDGKLYPIEDIKKEKKMDEHYPKGMLFGDIDNYIPIQVKRTDQVGRPDIENFQTAMKRDGRVVGIFVGFDFSRDAEKEIRRLEREENLTIKTVRVDELVNQQLDKQIG